MKALVSVLISQEFNIDKEESIYDSINLDPVIKYIDQYNGWSIDDIEIEYINESSNN